MCKCVYSNSEKNVAATAKIVENVLLLDFVAKDVSNVDPALTSVGSLVGKVVIPDGAQGSVG